PMVEATRGSAEAWVEARVTQAGIVAALSADDPNASVYGPSASAPSRGFDVIERRHHLGYSGDDPAERTVFARSAAAVARTWTQPALGRAFLSAAGNPSSRAARGAACHPAGSEHLIPPRCCA